MSTPNENESQSDNDPNFKPVYKGGTVSTLVEKDDFEAEMKEEVLDQDGRVLFNG